MPAPRPGTHPHTVVAPAPGTGPGFWAGAPSSAPLPGGGVALAWRERRGHDGTDRNVLAVSADGVAFEEVGRLESARFGARWVERPTLLRTPAGRWRLYACCASPSGPQWWIEVLEADDLPGLVDAPSRRVLEPVPSQGPVAVKDPVVQVREGIWTAWVCCHLLDVPGAEDRMRTDVATSTDGLTWTWRGTALAGTPGAWDARGARITCVLPDGTALYDGRASREENWFERSGVAAPGPGGRLRPAPGGPVDVRYVDVLPLPGGGARLYYEARTPDGSHELRTELAPVGA
ncbi:hypothetical protein [Kineococcus glutinatus]|uniref:Exo-alpha-sialidase n=1 Tax=Kineococcus glutinatus TaxID=1070872 RepID=A0ABP9HW35_9ACTN